MANVFKLLDDGRVRADIHINKYYGDTICHLILAIIAQRYNLNMSKTDNLENYMYYERKYDKIRKIIKECDKYGEELSKSE